MCVRIGGSVFELDGVRLDRRGVFGLGGVCLY